MRTILFLYINILWKENKNLKKKRSTTTWFFKTHHTWRWRKEIGKRVHESLCVCVCVCGFHRIHKWLNKRCAWYIIHHLYVLNTLHSGLCDRLISLASCEQADWPCGWLNWVHVTLPWTGVLLPSLMQHSFYGHEPGLPRLVYRNPCPFVNLI